MEQITVIKPDASTYTVGSSLPAVVILKAEQSTTLMGEDNVSLDIESAISLSFEIGDSIIVYGRKYTLFEIPEVEKISDNRFRYSLQFKGAIHELQFKLFKLDGSTGSSGIGDFSLMGNLDRFAGLVIDNMDSAASAWVKGNIMETGVKNLTFSNESCQTVISKLCDEFSVEFNIQYVAGQFVLNMDSKITRDLPDTLKYGKGSGLTSIKRKYIPDENFVTLLYGFGSTRNLPAGYRNYSTRLKMPAILPSDFEPPTAPQNPSISYISGSTFRLSWEASTDNVGVVSYQVYSSNNGAAFTLLDTVAGLYKDIYYPNGSQFRFKVYALDAAGNRSRASNTVYLSSSSTDIDPPILTSLTQLLPGLRVNFIKPVKDYDNIEIYRHTGDLGSGQGYDLIATINNSVDYYSDTDVTVGERYFYYARSKRSGYLYSVFSNNLDATVIID